MQIINVDITSIKPYANNPRNNANAIDAVANSIKEFGLKQPIVIDKDYEIIAGHTRLKAAQKLGLSEVPCILADDLLDEQIRAYRLADNKTHELSEWDLELLDVELDGIIDIDMSDFGFELDLGNEELPITDEVVEDDFDGEMPIEPQSKRGDVYQLGRHRLMCGDSSDADDVANLMSGDKADLCFTDPPYGVDYDGGIVHSGKINVHHKRDKLINDNIDIYPSVFEILSKVCEGACYIWFSGQKGASVYINAEKFGVIHSLIVWVKSGQGYAALNANYKPKHETCLYWKPKGKTLKFVGDSSECTVWECTKERANKLHPTQKPIELAWRAIKNHDAEKVLDLFGGSGSTLIACEQLNRICYMMELDPKYCDVIISRWEQFTGKEAKLISG